VTVGKSSGRVCWWLSAARSRWSRMWRTSKLRDRKGKGDNIIGCESRGGEIVQRREPDAHANDQFQTDHLSHHVRQSRHINLIFALTFLMERQIATKRRLGDATTTTTWSFLLALPACFLSVQGVMAMTMSTDAREQRATIVGHANKSCLFALTLDLKHRDGSLGRENKAAPQTKRH
jgi:hypothetical protein